MTTIILTIGNEILSGHILDTNTHWLCERLFLIGEKVSRVLILPDEESEVRNAIKEIVHAGGDACDYLFVCGGLGATHDDITMSAINQATKRRLVVSEESLGHMEKMAGFLLEKGFIKTKMVVNDAVRKMATVVEGGTVLENKAGFCPGVTFIENRTRLFVLPGVPQELKTIFTSEIEGTYIVSKGGRYCEEVVLSEVEARIAHILKKLGESFPGVSIGSYPTYGAKKLIIRAMGEDEASVKRVLDEIRRYSESQGEI